MIPASVCLLHRRSLVGTRMCPIDNIPSPPNSLGEYWREIMDMSAIPKRDTQVETTRRLTKQAGGKREGIFELSPIFTRVCKSVEAFRSVRARRIESMNTYLDLVLTLDQEIEHLLSVDNSLSIVGHQSNDCRVPIVASRRVSILSAIQCRKVR